MRARLPRSSITVGVVLTLLAGIVVAACGRSGNGRDAQGRLRIVASFYPLQWMAQQVGGPHVRVDNLTKPGAEPHDLELTPREVASVDDAAVLVYLSGFQPSVDAAVDDADGPAKVDVRRPARLDLTADPQEDGAGSGEGAKGADPHFWLDPTRLAAVAGAFARTMASEDPEHAADYRARLRGLDARLGTLDAELRSGLADCPRRDLVTSHRAFAYLARRYGLRQVGVSGLTPETEPSPKDLARVTRYVERHHVRTIYFETLVSPAVARTVAAEAGARTAVLDPIEGLDARSHGSDYLGVMRANLHSLRRGQPCP